MGKWWPTGVLEEQTWQKPLDHSVQISCLTEVVKDRPAFRVTKWSAKATQHLLDHRPALISPAELPVLSEYRKHTFSRASFQNFSLPTAVTVAMTRNLPNHNPETGEALPPELPWPVSLRKMSFHSMDAKNKRLLILRCFSLHCKRII